MKIMMITNEYPPHIYGGAGVHVDYLCRELVRLDDARHRLKVLCFGDQQESGANFDVTGIAGMPDLSRQGEANEKVIDVLRRNIAITGLAGNADIVHCHTWYAFLAGCLVKQFPGEVGGIKNSLCAAFPVADIDKDNSPQIAAGMDPAGEADRLPEVLRAQFVAMMRTFHLLS